MVDTHDLKSCAFLRAGSSPAGGIYNLAPQIGFEPTQDNLEG